MKLFAALLAMCSAGCFATIPAPFGEGTEVLKPHATGVTLLAAGGGAGGLCSGTQSCPGQGGVGGELRVRLGLRGNQEIGVSGYGAFLGRTADASGKTPPSTFIAGGEVSYKIAPVSWFALVGGAGAADQGGNFVVGGNLGAIIAPYTSEHGSQLYTGARGSFGIPVINGAKSATESVIVPVGFSFKSGGDVRVFLESGLAIGFNQLSTDGPPPTSQSSTYVGGYGAVGILLVVR
jgi:hypothetical protein